MKSKEPKEFIKEMISRVSEKSEEIQTETAPQMASDEEIINLGENFDFDGFQVVRREFFAHINEPSVTFSNCKFYVNTACIQKFPDHDSVQVLVNKDKKILAIMPCAPSARDSFVWCSISKEKRKPKQITCKLFFAKVFTMMGWNPDHRYKILGKLIHANGENLIAFDLTATEIYQRVVKEGAKPKHSRMPVFPAEWQNQFGLSYNEHKQSLQVDILNGYAIYSIKDSEFETGDEKTIDDETSLGVFPQSHEQQEPR